jgi:hypothetical protein
MRQDAQYCSAMLSVKLNFNDVARSLAGRLVLPTILQNFDLFQPIAWIS